MQNKTVRNEHNVEKLFEMFSTPFKIVSNNPAPTFKMVAIPKN
jgi:hypothetical protein